MDLETQATEITPKELKKRLDAGQEIAILDVREPHELLICKLEKIVHIPMGQLPVRVNELDHLKNKQVVVHCRSGGRSARCADFLRTQGFTNVLNLDGGILGWSDEVDPNIQKY
jgi:adenylyltransferase/sulfurtransferase